MYSNSFQFSLENFQPFFIYIKKCRMFEDQLICLDPHYTIEREGETFKATKDAGYVDLTFKKGIDIIALCGRNGLGKSTLLRIMQAQNFAGEKDYTLFWRDVSGNILGTNKTTVVVDGREIVLDKDMLHFDTIGGLCGNRTGGVDGLDMNSLEHGFVQMYASYPRIYDEGDRALFDGFYIDYSPGSFDEHHSLGDFFARKLHDPSAAIAVPSIIETHPTLHVLADIAQDSTFEHWLEVARRKVGSFERLAGLLMDDESRALDNEILHLLYRDGKIPSGLESLSKDDHRRTFRFEDHRATREAVNALSERVDLWIEKKLKEFDVHLWEGRLNELLWDHAFKTQPDGSKSGISDLSSGEYQRLRMRYLVAPYLFQDQIGWFYFDDADARLHPEWSRRYVFDLVNAFAETAARINKIKGRSEEPARRLTCILVTHAPFILSDLMPQNILLLTGAGGKTSVERGDCATFAGNIGQMFHTEFFMETTIGEFARRHIHDAIKALEASPTPEELLEIEKLFGAIGDEVLRSLLFEKLDYAKNQS